MVLFIHTKEGIYAESMRKFQVLHRAEICGRIVLSFVEFTEIVYIDTN